MADPRSVVHSPLVQDRDDEIGVLLDSGGNPPPECLGRHCKHCGEEVEVPFTRGLADCVQEYRHTEYGTVHCVIATVNGRPLGFAEETAAPCWRDGCKSNAGHEASDQ